MNKIENIIHNKKKWKGIIITQNATIQIISLMNSNLHNKGIRVSIKKSGCAGLRYSMELVQKENQDDISFSINNILIYIHKNHIPLINGITIDFIEDNINKVFKFYNKKIEHFCGCGESFSFI